MVRRVSDFTLVAVLAFVSASFCAAENPPPSDARVTYLPGMFSEFLIDADGSVVLFPWPNERVTRVWRGGQWHEDPALTPEGTVWDAIPIDQHRWIVLSQLAVEEVLLYEYSAGSLRILGRIPGKFQRPVLHRASDGTIWVTSWEGVAYCLRDGKVISHAFGPEVKKAAAFWYYPPTLSLETPHHGLWFWSQVEHEAGDFAGASSRPAIDGFHVYQDGAWRTVSRGAGRLGGAILQDAGTIIACGRYTGMFSLKTDDGDVGDLDWPLPPGEHGVFLHRTSAGHLLLVTARPSKFMRLSPVHRGWLGQLVAIDNGQVQVLLDGVDFRRDFDRDKGRPTVDVPEGTFLAESQTGLLFVSADLKTVKRLDWRFGVPLPNINRVRVSNRHLCALDRERGFAIFDYPSLLKTQETPATREWAVIAAASAPAISPDGAVWYLTASEPAELRRRIGTDETTVPLAGSQFGAENLWYLTADSKNRIWLISNFANHRTAFLENGRWRTFDSREKAYSTVALEEAGHPEYRLGSPADHCYPAFAGDGRVAYRNEWSRICVFDGGNWDASYSEGRIDGYTPEGPPFYNRGLVSVWAGDSYYQLVESQWKRTHMVKSPYPETLPRQGITDALPGSFPGDRDPSRCPVQVHDNLGTVWAGSFDRLWRGLGDVWVPFSLTDSPLVLGSQMNSIQVDEAGYIWFSLEGGDYTRLARYQPQGAAPKLQWLEPPQTGSHTGFPTLRVRIVGANKHHVVRYQVDNSEWKQSPTESATCEVSLDNLSDGGHTLRVQVFDDLLRASNLLEHRITVKRDYEQEIREWVALLKSSDFSERERAAKALVPIGRPALPALAALEGTANADVQWWIRAIREDIERHESQR